VAALAEVHPGALATGPYRKEEEECIIVVLRWNKTVLLNIRYTVGWLLLK
jgi:hypothetical protein